MDPAVRGRRPESPAPAPPRTTADEARELLADLAARGIELRLGPNAHDLLTSPRIRHVPRSLFDRIVRGQHALRAALRGDP